MIFVLHRDSFMHALLNSEQGMNSSIQDSVSFLEPLS